MTYDQWMEFLHVTGACLFVLIIVAGVRLGAAADVTVFTSRSRKVKQFTAADLIVTGGNGIITFYIWRWWRRRMLCKG